MMLLLESERAAREGSLFLQDCANCVQKQRELSLKHLEWKEAAIRGNTAQTRPDLPAAWNQGA